MIQRPVLLALCNALTMAVLLVAGCTAPPAKLPVMPSNPVPMRLAQIGYGRDAKFEQCRANACPQPTPKTLPSASPAPAERPLTPSASDIGAASAAGIASAAQPEIVPVEVPPPEATPAEQQIDIQFLAASAQLDDQARETLRQIAPRLAHASQIHVIGHTDGSSTAEGNERLAKARADAVLHELIELEPGIEPIATVQAQGACSKDTPTGGFPDCMGNRRAEIRYLPGSNAPP